MIPTRFCPVFSFALLLVPLAGQVAEPLPGELLVKVEAGAWHDAGARLAVLGLPAGRPLVPRVRGDDRAGVGRILRLQVPAGTEDTAVARLRAAPFVAWAERNRRTGGPCGRTVPDDTAFASQWAFDNPLQGIDMDVPEAWCLRGTTRVAPDLVVAVIDTGWDFGFQHPDLAGVLWSNPGEVPGNGVDDDGNGFVDDVTGYDFVDDDGHPQSGHDHGTWVGALIAAHTGNAAGIAGLADGSRLMVLRIFNNQGGFPATGPYSGHAAGAAALVYAADNGADIVNCSWTVGTQPSLAVNDAIDYATDNGVHVVVAAGNAELGQGWPAEHQDAIAVTGIAPQGNKSIWCSFATGCSGANYGAWVDLSAAGSYVPTLGPGILPPFTTLEFNGTSAAAPTVCGVAAMVLSEARELSVADLRDLLMQSAVDLDPLNPAFAGLMGAGHVNALGALRLLAPVADAGYRLAGRSRPALNAWGTTGPGGRLLFSVSRGPASAGGAWAIGTGSVFLPVLGGVLVPNPNLVLPLQLDADGAARLPVPLAAGLPAGTSLWVQAALLDAGAPQGVALTNAVRVRG